MCAIKKKLNGGGGDGGGEISAYPGDWNLSTWLFPKMATFLSSACTIGLLKADLGFQNKQSRNALAVPVCDNTADRSI